LIALDRNNYMNFFSQLALLAQEAAPAAEVAGGRGPLMYYMNQAGFVYGLTIPLLALLLTAVGAVMLAAVRHKVYFVLFLACAVLPLVLGVLGTVHGYLNMMQVIAMSNTEVKPAELAEGYQAAIFTTYVGALASLPPAALAIAGLACKGSRRP
jgi:hypothetical protein